MSLEKQFDLGAGLNKALQEFWAHGFEATSMQDLVDCMGVNRASLYATAISRFALAYAGAGHGREGFIEQHYKTDQTPNNNQLILL